MKKCGILLWALFGMMPMKAHAIQVKTDSFTVYYFLLEDCKISQAYTNRIAELYATYHCDSIGFVALFPNSISNDSTVLEFYQKHELPMLATKQAAYERAQQFAIEVTPEVVVYNESRQQIVYQGRIDNLFERIGQRRKVVNSHDLANALQQIQRGETIVVSRTKPVGCFFYE